MKKQKDEWDDQFDTDKATYEKLRCLQGLVIPTCYGQVQYEGTRALVLSDIGGACVAEPEGAVLREHDVRTLFDQARIALANQGISHDGVNKAIMIAHLERINELPPEKDRAWVVQADVDFLMQAYQDHLDCLREDGLLLPHANVRVLPSPGLISPIWATLEGQAPADKRPGRKAVRQDVNM